MVLKARHQRFRLPSRTPHWLKVASVEWSFVETVGREEVSAALALCERALLEAREAGGERTLDVTEELDVFDDSQLAPSKVLEELVTPLGTQGNEYAFKMLQEWDGAAAFSIEQARMASAERERGLEESRRRESLVKCLVAWSEAGLMHSAEWWLSGIFRPDHMPSGAEGPVQQLAKFASSAPEPATPKTKGRAFAAGLMAWLSEQRADASSAALPMLLTMEPTYHFNSVSFHVRKRDWLRAVTSGFAWALIGYNAVCEALNLADGSSYEGEHRNGKPHGSGEQTWRDGRRFRGDFRDGLPDGFGTMVWPTGDRLESRWRRGRSRGPGVMTLPNGMSYSGELRLGRQHGRWITTAPDGRKVESRWFWGKQLSRRRVR